MRDDGLLAFTYHHSRPEGWHCVLSALLAAGFAITAAHPVKAEMSVAVPKLQAKEPIDLDIVMVCRKLSRVAEPKWDGSLLATVAARAKNQAKRFVDCGRLLGRNDVRVIVMAQILRWLSSVRPVTGALAMLADSGADAERLIDEILLS